MTNEDKTHKFNIKNNTVRLVLITLVFLLCAGGVFIYLNKVFTMGHSDPNRMLMKGFYAQKEDSLDVIYLGTSATNRYCNTPMMFHDEGIAGYNVATMGMPMFFIPILVDEIQKTHDPDLYIIELRWVDSCREEVTDAHIRRITDNLKYSQNRVDAIEKAWEFMDGETGLYGDITYDKLDYMLPIVKYHSRLAQGDLKLGDIKPWIKRNKTKGYVMTYSTTLQVNQFKPKLTDKRAELEPEIADTLDEVLDCCDELSKQDKEILFVLAPYSVKTSSMAKFNTAIDTVEARGYDVLNFNTYEMYEELDLDWDHDFYNSMHVNYLGAEKYTGYLEKYLAENYDLKDHRGDENYDSWEGAYNYYKEYTGEGILSEGHKDRPGGPVTMIREDNPKGEEYTGN